MPNENSNTRLTIATESYSLERFKKAVEKYQSIQSGVKIQQNSNTQNIESNSTKTKSDLANGKGK